MLPPKDNEELIVEVSTMDTPAGIKVVDVVASIIYSRLVTLTSAAMTVVKAHWRALI